MFSRFLELLGTATDVRSLAAVVLGVLLTVLGHQSVIVTSVVDGLAGVIVLVDTVELHHTAREKLAASLSKPASSTAPTTATTSTG